MSSTINTSIRPQAMTSTQEVTPQSASDATSVWQSVLQQSRTEDAKLKGSTAYLGDARIERYSQKVKTDLDAFVAQNPSASPDEIAQYTADRVSKHKGYETVSKMTDDYFLSRMAARTRELMADLWE